MAIFVAMLAAMVEIAVASVVYISVAAPGRLPRWVGEVPVFWRLILLLVVSVLCGMCIQLMGVSHRSH